VLRLLPLLQIYQQLSSPPESTRVERTFIRCWATNCAHQQVESQRHSCITAGMTGNADGGMLPLRLFGLHDMISDIHVRQTQPRELCMVELICLSSIGVIDLRRDANNTREGRNLEQKIGAVCHPKNNSVMDLMATP
jgi:hypothetical protein